MTVVPGYVGLPDKWLLVPAHEKARRELAKDSRSTDIRKLLNLPDPRWTFGATQNLMFSNVHTMPIFHKSGHDDIVNG